MSNAKGFYHARAVHYPVFGNYNESSIQEGLSLNFSVANICERRRQMLTLTKEKE